MDDLLVTDFANARQAGTLYVYRGTRDGLDERPVARVFGEVKGDSFGWDVAGAGDINGDGHADLVVSAPIADYPAGAAYVYEGRRPTR